MNCIPDKDTLRRFEESSQHPPASWLRRINANDLCYRWWFYHVCQFYGIATALELGVEQARTTCVLAAAVTDLAIGVEAAPNWTWINETLAALPEEHRGKVRFVVGNSINPETVAEVGKVLNGRPIELLFIDSHHTAEHATAELAAYMPMLAPVALVVIDDIINHPPLRDVFYSILGDHVELNHLHALEGLVWAPAPPAKAGGFGVVIVRRDGEQ